MKRRAWLMVALLLVLLPTSQTVLGEDCAPVLMYTGDCGTVVVSLPAKGGAALYTYPQYDAAYNTTLVNLREDHCYYCLDEKEYPRWYWRVAKHPSYSCCCHRRRCWSTCLGYSVELVERIPGGERVEICFYANRVESQAFAPVSTAAGATPDDRRR